MFIEKALNIFTVVGYDKRQKKEVVVIGRSYPFAGLDEYKAKDILQHKHENAVLLDYKKEMTSTPCVFFCVKEDIEINMVESNEDRSFLVKLCMPKGSEIELYEKSPGEYLYSHRNGKALVCWKNRRGWMPWEALEAFHWKVKDSEYGRMIIPESEFICKQDSLVYKKLTIISHD